MGPETIRWAAQSQPAAKLSPELGFSQWRSSTHELNRHPKAVSRLLFYDWLTVFSAMLPWGAHAFKLRKALDRRVC